MSRGNGLLQTSSGSHPGAFGVGEWGLLTGTALIWGSSYLWIELALRNLHPGVIGWGRITLGLGVLVLLPGDRPVIAPQDRGRMLLVGTGWFGLPMVTFPIAQGLGVASSVVGMLNGAMPLLTTLFASILLWRVPRPRHLVGLLVGFAGLVAIVAPEYAAGDSAALGVTLFLATMSVNALLVSVLVPLQQRYGSLGVLRHALRIAFLVTLPFGLFGLTRSTFALGSTLAMLPLGLLSTAVAFLLWSTLVGRVGASRGSLVSYLVPIVAMVLGVMILGERIEGVQLVGIVTVLAGAWLLSGGER